MSQLKEQARLSEASSTATNVLIGQLEGRLGESPAKVFALSSAQETHSSAVQVLHCKCVTALSHNHDVQCLQL